MATPPLTRLGDPSQLPLTDDPLTEVARWPAREDRVPFARESRPEQPVMEHIPHRISGSLDNSRMIMRQSFFFGNHSGIGPEEREYIADSVIEFLNASTKK